ncbi:hypothetical protein U1Q18_030447 [Sarracenia purpurea var. burkii]
MENPSQGPASFWTQTDALFRKNLAFQKRNKKANCRLLSFPIILCSLLGIGIFTAKKQFKTDESALSPVRLCPAAAMDSEQAPCSIPSPPENPPLLRIPRPENRAVRTSFAPFGDLPDGSCKKTNSCPATILVTGNDKSLGLNLSGIFFTSSSILNSFDSVNVLADGVFGSASPPRSTIFIDPAFSSKDAIYNLQRRCSENSTASISIGFIGGGKEIKCLQALSLWRNSSSEINDELFKGYMNGNSEGKVNEIVAAYDFLNSNKNNFNVTIWYNSTFNKGNGDKNTMTRVARSVNLVSNAYLELFRGPGFKILFEFLKEMPKQPSSQQLVINIPPNYLTIMFTWVILQLFPVMLTSLVYDKQENIRIMMKMHGLGDVPYWMISYIYFLVVSSAYMLCFVVSCCIIGLKFFTVHDYSLQFVFYFAYLNLQIAFSFLVAGIFSKVRSASFVAYLVVIGTGIFGSIYFQAIISDDASFPRVAVAAMELYPGLALYRVFYEFSMYEYEANLAHTSGMRWEDLLNGRSDGMKDVLIVMVVEWFVFVFFSNYVGKKSPLFFFRRKPASSSQRTSLRRDGSGAFDQVEKDDVAQEREKVEQLLVEPNTSYAIVCDNLKKVYPGMDGNPAKQAVRGLSLALPQGECFGMLGPNGAGKTSFIKMMIGLTKPSSGTAFVQGLDIQTDMDSIYTSMGVCPQHDLLWETLTGREHLLFYGRLKNLKGSALSQAVEESLRSVNLLNGGVADKQAGKYSGGMKRRLSVAISLIGDPKVVYMDEPSTGLDPASRNELWKVVMRAKMNRAIILTTHSMEEAEHLCDRLGIFVDGRLQCIGNPKQLKARFGGFYVFTITTSFEYEQFVDNLVCRLSPSAKKTYHISGTQKFELPKHEVKIADVFEAVETMKSKFDIQAWGLVDTTLEDVFIKVACEAESFHVS